MMECSSEICAFGKENFSDLLVMRKGYIQSKNADIKFESLL
jgi:hypothetical protein